MNVTQLLLIAFIASLSTLIMLMLAGIFNPMLFVFPLLSGAATLVSRQIGGGMVGLV